jgi:hypothetical protein
VRSPLERQAKTQIYSKDERVCKQPVLLFWALRCAWDTQAGQLCLAALTPCGQQQQEEAERPCQLEQANQQGSLQCCIRRAPLTHVFFFSLQPTRGWGLNVCVARVDKEARAQLERVEEGAQSAGGAVTGERREAEGESRRSSILQESDAAFLIKLLFTSFGGAAHMIPPMLSERCVEGRKALCACCVECLYICERGVSAVCTAKTLQMTWTEALHSCLTATLLRTGAAAVKYGSLLLDAPFQPNLPLALAIITSPILAYSAFLLLKSRDSG